MLLDLAGESIKNLRSFKPSGSPPGWLRESRRSHGRINIRFRGLRDLGKGPGVGGIESLEVTAFARVGEVASDEQSETSAVRVEPLLCQIGAFRRRAVFERL